MDIHVITLFPAMFNSPFAESMVKRSLAKGLVKIHFHNLRKWTTDKRQTVDDRPFGGGAGMVLMVEPIYKALKEIRSQYKKDTTIVTILTSAKGKKFSQAKARKFSKTDVVIIICGHYEGIDERISEHLVDEELSIGNYVLTGGELPAMVMIDAIVRLIPGVLGNENSVEQESFSIGLKKEGPQYTRPAVFVTDEDEQWKVPDILLSGNHKQIDTWRTNQPQN